MEKLDNLGIFWLAGRQEDALSGRLTFDPEEDGTRLSLVGIFEPHAHRNFDAADVRIHGWIDNDAVTLDRCFVTGVNHRQPGPYASSYYANELFIGYHLEGEKVFDSVIVTIEYLDVLVKNCGLSERSTTEGHIVELIVPESESAGFSIGTVSVGFNWETGNSSLTEASLKSKPYFKIDYNSRRDFCDIQDDISHLGSLVSLCVGEPAAVDRTLLRRSDLLVIMIDGSQSSILQPVEYRAPQWGYVPNSDRKRLIQHDLLLNLDELGGVERVASWLDEANRVHRPISSLMTILRTRHMFAENKFMNVTYAAEALHRILDGSGRKMDQGIFDDLINKYLEITPLELHQWLRDRLRHSNEPSLTKRLTKMAAQVGSMVTPMIGRRERWANTIAMVRNDITHLGSHDDGLDGGTLYYLTESVFTIARLYLLLEIGAPEEVLRANSSRQKAFRETDRVIKSMEAARNYLRARGVL
jgi:ApeA N-terminal domain 1/Apea-like HEPN